MSPTRRSPEAAAPPQHRTKSEAALQVLRTRILAGEYEPGDQLRAEALAAELGMSATPVREALRLLQADHLVVSRPHQGIVVAGLSPREVEEIYMVRALLEGPATELATPAVRAGAMDRLEGVHAELLERASSGGERSEIGSLNADWHWTIYRLVGADYLTGLIEGLWERFPWRTMWARPEDVQRSVREHEAIMAAIREDRSELAGRLMREHVLSGRDDLLAPRASKPPRG